MYKFLELSTEFFIIYYLSVFLIWYILLYLSLCREMCKGCELVTHFSLYIYILHARWCFTVSGTAVGLNRSKRFRVSDYLKVWYGTDYLKEYEYSTLITMHKKMMQNKTNLLLEWSQILYFTCHC